MLYKKLIFILFIEIIRAFIISGFASTFLNKNGKTFLRTGVYSLSVTITAFLYAAFNNSVLNVLSKVLGLSFISLAYRGKIKNRCLFVLYVMAVGCMMDLIVYAVLSKTPDYNNYSSYASILSLLLLLVAESVTKRLFGNDGKAELSNRSWLLYTIFLLVCVLTTLFIAMDKAISSLTLTVVCGAILVVNVIIAYLIDDLIRLSRDALENQALNDQIRAYEREMNFQDQRLEDLRSFKHDIKRHFSEITALADTGNTREIKRYMSELDNYINKSPVIVDSGNTVIDTVLNYMLRRAADNNIQVVSHVVIPKELELSAYDMNIILGNLIENAIEAQEEVTDPRLELSLSFLNGSLIIDIKNSCSHEVRFSKGLPLTSKQPADEHGYGIRNVKSILDKYRSSMFMDCSDGFFTVRIIMEINGSLRRKY